MHCMRSIAAAAGLVIGAHLAAPAFGEGEFRRGAFPYWPRLAWAPRVTAVDPATGPAGAVTQVTIRGHHLDNAQVSIDGAPVQPLARTSNEVRVAVPAGPNGYVSLALRTAFGVANAEFVREPPRLQDLPNGYITTVAGVGEFWGDGRPATQAMVEASDLALGASGEIFVGEPGQARIRRIRADGVIEPYAGNGIEGAWPDGGQAVQSRLWQPRGITLDAEGNLFIAEAFNHRVRRVDARTGIVTTVAGTGEAGFAGDGGPARSARLSFPNAVAFDGTGNLFVLECGNSRVRRIDTAGNISTFVGTGTPGFSGDGGLATAAQINIGDGVFIDVGGIAVDPAGNVYVADTTNNRIRRVERASGVITTVAEGSQQRAVATDAQGNVYFANNNLGAPQGPRIVKLDAQMRVVATFGRGHGTAADGAVAADAAMGFIDRVRVDAAGNILYTDFTTLRIRRIDAASGRLQTVAGIGPAAIGSPGPATHAVLGTFNADIAFDAAGRLLITDNALHRIHRLGPDGRLQTWAGNGLFGLMDVDDVPAAEAQIFGPFGLDVKPDGSVLVIDGHSVRTIGTDGVIRLAAGNAFRDPGLSGDGGPAIGARFLQPLDVIADAGGNLYIADTNNNRVRRVDAATGVVTTVAGSGAPNGFENYGAGTTCGDGGPATSACINTPYGVAVDHQGNLFVSENWQRIRKVAPNGVITTLAPVYATKMAIDAAGNLFVVAHANVLRISPQGNVTTLAGTGTPGFSGDGGPATAAQLYAPGQASGIAIAPNGDLYFSDGGNKRIRVIKGGALPP